MTRTPLLFLAIGVQMATCLPASGQVTGPPVQAPIDVLRPQEQFAWLDSVPVGTPPDVWIHVPISLRELHPSVSSYLVSCSVDRPDTNGLAAGKEGGVVPVSGDVSGRVDIPIYMLRA